jgi:outer membrane protein assembly factor BamB
MTVAITNLVPFIRKLLVFTLVLLGGGCSAGFLGEKEAEDLLKGKRLSINYLRSDLMADKRLENVEIVLPYPKVNKLWLKQGGNSTNSMQHLSLGDTPQKIWEVKAGVGSSKDSMLLASPIVIDGKVFVLDSKGMLKAFNLSDGSSIWERNLKPAEISVYSGAIASDSRYIFVTLGSGELVCIKSSDGSEVWRTPIKSPLRGGATVVDDRIYVVTIDNKTLSFSAKTGQRLWTHAGAAESAALIGGGSPSVKSNVVVVSYSSGEVFGLKAETGRVFWADHLGADNRLNGVGHIADINGSPVIDRGLVFNISNSGRLLATELRTGGRIWERAISGANTPWIAGDFIFIISNEGQIICLTRKSGLVKWVTQMPVFEAPEDKEGIIKYVGPIIVGDRLIIASSLGEIYSLSPYKGTVLGKVNISGNVYIPPIVAGQTLLVLSDSGVLTAFR